MAKSSDGQLWAFAHAERAELACDLKDLAPEQWSKGTLCGKWDVEQVVAHLTAAASLNQWQWIRSMLGARFRPDVHNQRRLDEHIGTTPTDTLELFQSVINSSIAPSSDTPAYLGEVLVHSPDIRRPLGLPYMPNIDALTAVAEFYARRNFTVSSRTRAAGLQLKADDGPFKAGDGPIVTGSTLALVMALAGRVPYVGELQGPGVPMLASRIIKPLL